MADEAEEKPEKLKCFVIAEIGSDGSTERRRSDMALDYIIRPTLETTYDVRRADDDRRSGQITRQMMNEIDGADLIVANLTGLNPNVFYELGIAHSQRKRVIHLFEEGTVLPFDLSHSRGIPFIIDDPKSHTAARDQLADFEAQIRDEKEVSNPWTDALIAPTPFDPEDLKKLVVGDLIDQIGALSNRLSALESNEQYSISGGSPRLRWNLGPKTEKKLKELRAEVSENMDISIGAHMLQNLGWSNTEINSLAPETLIEVPSLPFKQIQKLRDDLQRFENVRG